MTCLEPFTLNKTPLTLTLVPLICPACTTLNWAAGKRFPQKLQQGGQNTGTDLCGLTLRVLGYLNPKVCKIMAFRAIIMGLGPLFYTFLGVLVLIKGF